MSGFKNFVLRGNLVETAVALIMALSFATVVSTFTAVLTGFTGKVFEQPDFSDATIADVNVGQFINAMIAFLILSVIVYFLVVMPYTKAKERFFPIDEKGPTEVELLTQIRDALATRA
jgi:large conductance mechanosensitive channel